MGKGVSAGFSFDFRELGSVFLLPGGAFSKRAVEAAT
jgi:hypothetical protein